MKLYAQNLLIVLTRPLYNKTTLSLLFKSIPCPIKQEVLLSIIKNQSKVSAFFPVCDVNAAIYLLFVNWGLFPA